MTQFTSFVAVEDRVVTKDGKPERVEVPVEMPEGVSYEGVFGKEQDGRGYVFAQLGMTNGPVAMKSMPRGGFGGGSGGGPVGSVNQTVEVTSSASVAAAPPPPLPPMSIPRDSLHHQSKLSPERKALESKLQPALLRAFDCAATHEHDCKLVHDGVVELEIWLSKSSPSVLEQLRSAGFRPATDRSGGKRLLGKLPVENLRLLAQIAEVKFVSAPRK
jgi:hypothetical protein